MQHMDIWATNVMIAAHQENVARALQDSQRRSAIMMGIGTLLIRAGQWLRRDVGMPARVDQAVSARRSQLA